MIWLIIPLMLIAGTFGRMGGSKDYHTLWRDLGCPTILVLTCWIVFGWHTWQYGLVFLLSWAALSTYFDTIFGYDNFWFSGFMAGLAIFPIWFIDHSLWWIIPIRALLLCLVWGSLNKFLPQKGILIWRRDIVDEFCRYAITL